MTAIIILLIIIVILDICKFLLNIRYNSQIGELNRKSNEQQVAWERMCEGVTRLFTSTKEDDLK